MKTMRVMRFNGSLTAAGLIPGMAPIPQPREGELLIRVQAAGVTPTELQWYPTTHALDGSIRQGAILGHEFSGVVEAVGGGVEVGHIGREVFGMNDWFADGATADYCITVPTSVAAKPARLSHTEAASVPISALTAWQGLFDRAKLQPGERVLVHGGAGSVGIFAVQLARRAGAHVVTTASERNTAFLTQIGANEVIDYRRVAFEEVVRDMDVVFDVVGGETLRRSWSVLKPSGRLTTIAADSEGTADPRVKEAFFIVEPNGEQLTEIARLLESGELQCQVDAVVPFADASEAYGGTKRGRGKVVLSLEA